jgi:hypothetical protein
MPPAEHVPFVNRVQGIDQDMSAGERQSGGDGALAEPDQQREL